ncbi:MAG: aldo/keto reductase [Planctomycetes bacterium]|nr:aldo/keto reductase [Planctomycetota bacterium]
MNQRSLGESGIRVSAVALGTWAMGGDVAVWGHIDDRESIAAIQQALDCGINLIDTAPIYGNGHAEEIVGKAVSGRRNEVVIATKCGLVPPDRDGDLPIRNLSAKQIHRECEASLRRLRVDAIDIYHCHWPDPETPVRETMEALVTLWDQGKIRAIGLSNFGCERLAAAREFGPIHCLQPPFSMLNRRAADDLLPYCKEHQIGVICYGPLAKGLLTGKFHRDAKFNDLRSQDADFQGVRYYRNLDIVDELKKVAIKYDKTVGQLAINWAASFPGIAAPIFGAKRPSQVRENVGGIGWEISREDRDLIDRILGGPPGAI